MIPLLLIPALFSAMSWASDPAPPCMDEAAVLEEAERAFPSRYRDLMELRDRDPDRFARMIHNTAHALEDPDAVAVLQRLANAEDRLNRAGAAWNKAPQAQRGPLEAELNAAANAAVDLQQAARRERVNHIRETLGLLNAEIQDVDANRDTAVQDAIDHATR